MKLAIPTQNGNFIIIDAPSVIAHDPATLQALMDSWALYNRSAGVYVNDARVFLDSQNGEFYFATQLTMSDALPWWQFIGADSGPGSGGGGGNGGGGGVSDYTYRLILKNGPGRYDTGATYPACDPANPNACQPVQFATLRDAVAYAYTHGEIPYRVDSEAMTWDVVFGRVAIDPARIYSVGAFDPAEEPGPGGEVGAGIPWGMLAIGAALLLLASRRGQ